MHFAQLGSLGHLVLPTFGCAINSRFSSELFVSSMPNCHFIECALKAPMQHITKKLLDIQIA